MQFRLRGTTIALAAVALGLGCPMARAGDDGAAPLWEGIGSIVAPIVGLGHEEKPPIEYQEHGKLVVPKSMDLPPPGASADTMGGAWPVNQEIQRKRIAREKEKNKSTPVNPKLEAVRSFPNAPVVVNASDQVDNPAGATDKKAETSSVLGNLNPLGWVGLGKSQTGLGPEPDRDWLTDPPKGYRAPVATATTGAAAARPQQGQPTN